MQESYLVFESVGRHFAVPMSVVDNVADVVHADSVSFSEYFFKVVEEEPFCLVFHSGKSIKIHSFFEIVTPKDNVLPLPGYIFEGDAQWARGLLWNHFPRIIVLNESVLLERL